jgi:hypothetical protein
MSEKKTKCIYAILVSAAIVGCRSPEQTLIEEKLPKDKIKTELESDDPAVRLEGIKEIQAQFPEVSHE